MEAGEVVKLKSGGPRMTVLYHNQTDKNGRDNLGPGGVVCVWFDATENIQSYVFHEAQLFKVSK